ncbi:polyphosphate polymerase domain-containing protein [Candidatus Peregrinibacteria bacterium]|nr:polyphosphate polymerase domain-containing protein [Candidatus Peregrinibacteria bacterium]
MIAAALRKKISGTVLPGSPLHFRRVEIKYRVPDRVVPSFMEAISPYVSLDPYLAEGLDSYPVTSLYFDSLDLKSLYEKDAGLLSRRKVRLRTYHPTFATGVPCFLEIKRRHDCVVSKDRLVLADGIREACSLSQVLKSIFQRNTDGVAREAQILASWYGLQPMAFVRYRRIPFVGRHDRRFRVTVDTHLEGAWRPPYILGFEGFRECLPGESIIELKFNHAVPDWFHAVLQDFDLVRVSNSKYLTTMQSLRPSLHF